MNIKSITDKIQNGAKWLVHTKKGRVFLVSGGCAIAVCAISVASLNYLRSATTAAKDVNAQSTIPTVVEKIKAPAYSSEAPSFSATSSESTSVTSSAVSAVPSSSTSSTEKTGSAGAPAERAVSNQSQPTHYVRVDTAQPAAPSSAIPSSASSSGHIQNYQGVSETKTYTDTITGSPEVVQFLGVGAGYQEVAVAEIKFQTTAALGAARSGAATATLTGPVSESSPAVVGSTGTCSLFTVGNLTPGTYVAKLTAKDGTVVAQLQFTVQPGGLI